MAKYSITWQSITATAVADDTSYTDSGYPCFIQGGGATQLLKYSEIYIGGEDASASNPTAFVVSRDSVVGATGISGTTAALLDATSTAPGTVPVHGNVSTTKPKRPASRGSQLLRLSVNCYGGIVRWVAAPGTELTTYGASTTLLSELSISAVTGTGKTSGHVIVEVV